MFIDYLEKGVPSTAPIIQRYLRSMNTQKYVPIEEKINKNVKIA